jgi:hypothetical protein
MRGEESIEGIKYLRAKKRVEKIKGFYVHFIVYVIVNIFLSGIIIFGLMQDDGDSLEEVLQNFGVYSTWFFWGIGVFFHWLGVFGFNVVGKDWKNRKIKEILEKEERNSKP